jgi:hypothetical protein
VRKIKSLWPERDDGLSWFGRRGEARKVYQRDMAEGKTQGSRRGRIPRVRSEMADRLLKEAGMSWAGGGRLLGVSPSAISKILHRIAQGGSESFDSANNIPSSLFVLPSMTTVGIVVRVVVVWIRIIIWIWIIIWMVRVRVMIWFRAGLPTAFRTDDSILRKSDPANRIGV